jgi:hypothetical protein
LFALLQRHLHEQVRFASVLNAVDLEHFAAISLGSMAGGFIYCLDSQVRSKLLEEIRTIRELDGFPVTIEAFSKEEIYSGDQLALAPDIVLIVNGGEAAVVDRLSEDGRVFADERWHPSRSGNHRRNGIFFVVGPRIQPRELPTVQIVDIASSVLYLFGIKDNIEVNGQVIDILSDMLVSTPASFHGQIRNQGFSELNEQEEREIEKRLRDLGYL